MIQLIIPGKPIAKKRPRFARRGKFVTTYNDQETEESRFLWEVRHQMNGKTPFDGPIKVRFIFHMPIPKSTSKKKTQAMLNCEICHTKKPDCDNLEKFVADCLNGIAWKDDSQIVESNTMKFYSDEPRTVVLIQDVNIKSLQIMRGIFL